MKTVLTSLSEEQARKELPKYTKWALPGTIIGLFVFGYLGFLGIVFGARALLLTYHAGNKSAEKVGVYRLLAILATVLGLIDVVWYTARLR